MLITTIIFLSFSYGEFSGFFKGSFPVLNRNGSDCAELCSKVSGFLLFWFVYSCIAFLKGFLSALCAYGTIQALAPWEMCHCELSVAEKQEKKPSG